MRKTIGEKWTNVRVYWRDTMSSHPCNCSMVEWFHKAEKQYPHLKNWPWDMVAEYFTHE